MTASLHLYELSDARLILETWLSESEGELTPELDALITELDGSVEVKIERVGLFVRELQADAERIKIEEDRLRDRRKAREKAADSLKGYLKLHMERLGKDKVKGSLLTVALQLSPPAVTSTLTDEQMRDVYREYFPLRGFVVEVPVSYRIDRTQILAAVKAGESIPEGIAVTQDRHIRLR